MPVMTTSPLEEWVCEAVESQMGTIVDRLVAKIDDRGLWALQPEVPVAGTAAACSRRGSACGDARNQPRSQACAL